MLVKPACDARFFFEWYNGRMETSDWLIVGAICVSLLIGVTSLVQGKRIQRKQYRHGLLREIIQWAIDVHRWRSENRGVFSTLTQDVARGVPEHLTGYNHIASLLEYLKGQSGRNQYVCALAQEFDQPLQEAVQQLRQRLDAYEAFLESWAEEIRQDRRKYDERRDEADEQGSQLAGCANKVIAGAAEIEMKLR